MIMLALFVLWTFVPAVRDKMRSWSTVIEGVIVAMFPILGNVIDSFEQTNWKSYVPEHMWQYIVIALAAWFIFKRLITTGPVGKKL